MSNITSTLNLGAQPEQGDGLDEMSLADLQELAEMKGIENYGALGKEVLKNTIRSVSRETIPIVEEKQEDSPVEEEVVEEEDAS